MARFQRIVKDEVRKRAWRMRRNPTHAESILWNRLRLRRCGGFRFRQQAIIFGFIVDFYCPFCKLAVEVDGGIHNEKAEYDQMREAKIAKAGITVLRFSNDQVEDYTNDVVAMIEYACRDLAS